MNTQWGHKQLIVWIPVEDAWAHHGQVVANNPGGRHHTTARGNQPEALSYDNPDGQGFLDLVAELPKRFGLDAQAFVLMDIHYHLRLGTPESDLSPAVES